MAELKQEADYAWHHKKKLVLIFSAMRHFKKELEENGFKIFYTEFEDQKNTNSFAGELERAVLELKPQKIIITEPSEYRVLEIFKNFATKNFCEIEIRQDYRFIASHQDFEEFAGSKKEPKKKLVMEYFYRKMRIKTGLLMEKCGKKPIGGKWNLDSQNRQTMPSDVHPPKLLEFPISEISSAVIAMVERNFPQNFGENFSTSISTNFGFTAKQAEIHFADFLKNRLPNFGTYQDAMRDDVDFGFHSVIAIYLNLGLLDPLECCFRVEKEFLDGNCDLASAEGFIRQIIGWREYIRGIYWLFMPDYKDLNYFEHERALPEFYWNEGELEGIFGKKEDKNLGELFDLEFKSKIAENKTKSDKQPLNCILQVVKQTRKNAYSHHIQRLMITGNFALLAEISPAEINHWYLSVYADAFDWVELPNTHGMAIYADGGILASKPYCSSGNYINKMSNFCKKCSFDVKQSTGTKACPFNFLYWNFLIKNQQKLQNNPRLFYPYNNLRRKSKEEILAIQNSAEIFLQKITPKTN